MKCDIKNDKHDYTITKTEVVDGGLAVYKRCLNCNWTDLEMRRQ